MSGKGGGPLEPGLWTVREIAAHFSLDRKTVQSWRSRHPDFPEPVKFLTRTTPAYRPSEIVRWFQKHRDGSLLWGIPRT
jgi:predicted DNA-binding transcriptional regulator AlpA